MKTSKINKTDRRESDERRIGLDRRENFLAHNPGFRLPAWRDQQLQYLLRFFILFIGFAYFNLWDRNNTLWMSLTQLNIFFILYGLATGLCYWHAVKYKVSLLRFRLAIFIDVFGVSVATINDPVTLPPCMLVYIIIVLGNGMRYGMRMFRESLILSLSAAMIVMSFRYQLNDSEYGHGLILMNVIGLIILLYAYLLMSRLETSRINLEDLSQRDELTGLLNRRALYEKTEQLIESQSHYKDKKELVVMFADLDKFKQINDTHGHSAGDIVLKSVAEILGQSVREVDVVARFGGDEFIIVMPETSISIVETVSIRIQQSIREWAKANDFDFDVSLGIGAIPRHGKNLDDVLKSVDNAMYHGKLNHGPGGLCYATS